MNRRGLRFIGTYANWPNAEAAKIVERIDHGRQILVNHENFAFIGVRTVEKEPTNF
jgi:hypothetical protein